MVLWSFSRKFFVFLAPWTSYLCSLICTFFSQFAGFCFFLQAKAFYEQTKFEGGTFAKVSVEELALFPSNLKDWIA